MHILDLDQKQWRIFLEQHNEPSFRSKQIMQWLYHKLILKPDQMHNISKSCRELLQRELNFTLPKITSRHIAEDGTQKWLMQLTTGQHLETVYIPEAKRGTLCISSQVGCALACSFCATGLMGLNRNLKTHEIIAQIWLAQSELGAKKITNIVFMGMGEPLMNEPALYPALSIILDDLGFGLAKTRVTVSTSGVVPAIKRLKENSPCALAISLHAPNNLLRDQLVPLNKKYPLEQLLEACKIYTQGPEKRHILLEYLMLAGVNDQDKHAKELIHIASQFRCKVNLIPYNPVPGIAYTASNPDTVYNFQQRLKKSGIVATVRKQRGDPIAAACGQLAGKAADKTNRKITDS